MFRTFCLPFSDAPWRSFSTAALCALLASQAIAQAPASAVPAEGQCILAGRLDAEQRWAPQSRGVELLDAQGKRISASDKATLATVKQVRISSPALLASCNGSQALASGDDLAKAPKAVSPALSAGKNPVKVEAVNFPPLKIGGELVELRLSVEPARVIALKR